MDRQCTLPINHLSKLPTVSRWLDNKNQATKQAAVPHIATIAPEAAIANEALKAEALRKILGVGVAGLLGGAGLAGLIHLLKKFTKPKKPSYQVPVDIDMPVPEKRAIMTPLPPTLFFDALRSLNTALGALGAKGAVIGADDPQAKSKMEGVIKGIKKELPHVPLTALGDLIGSRIAGRLTAGLASKGVYGLSIHQLAKLLGAVGGGIGGYMTSKPLVEKLSSDKRADWADYFVRTFIPTPSGRPAPQIFSPSWLRGDTMREISSIPWMIPAILATGAAGVAGGSSLVNWLIRKRRKRLLKEELRKAQEEYESAMLGQYEPAGEEGKKAAKRYSLDDVVDMLEKRGFFSELLGKGTGSYLALAALIAGLSGLGTYRYLRGRSKDELLEKALKQRSLVRALSHPPDIYIHPVARASRPLRTDKDTVDEVVTEEDRPLL